jgi:hypothetical protein
VGNTTEKEGVRMKCFECGWEIVRQMTSLLFYKRDKTPVFFEDVPVGECRQCGEKYISGSVSEKISEFLESENIETKGHIKVPVVHLAA